MYWSIYNIFRVTSTPIQLGKILNPRMPCRILFNFFTIPNYDGFLVFFVESVFVLGYFPTCRWPLAEKIEHQGELGSPRYPRPTSKLEVGGSYACTFMSPFSFDKLFVHLSLVFSIGQKKNHLTPLVNSPPPPINAGVIHQCFQNKFLKSWSTCRLYRDILQRIEPNEYNSTCMAGDNCWLFTWMYFFPKKLKDYYRFNTIIGIGL